MMRAGFQRDISRGPHGINPRQRHHLGMRSPAGLGMAAPDNAAIQNNHTSNCRVRPGAPQPPRGQRKGVSHMVFVCHSSLAPAGRNSETNLSKSSAAWKFL